MNKSDLIKNEGRYKIEVLLTTSDGVYTIDYDGVIYASYFSARFNYEIAKRVTKPNPSVTDLWIRGIDIDEIIY